MRAQLDRRLARGEDPGLLCGLPVGIKDVTPVAGLRTTFGSPIYADHVPKEDALVVRRLREAGAVILGKTNCPEFAAGGNTFNEVFGRTRNPWDPTKSAGGSTGGGAAALATGMIALAEGTDLGGSLRIPASFCGVVGLRPSVGLVPTHPTDWVWDTLQVTGPMARTAEDVALMLQAIAGPSECSPHRAAGRRPRLRRRGRARSAQRTARRLLRRHRRHRHRSRRRARVPRGRVRARRDTARSSRRSISISPLARPAFLVAARPVVRHADVPAARHAGSLRPERRATTCAPASK